MKLVCHKILSNKTFDITSAILTIITVTLFVISTEIKDFDYYIWYICIEIFLFFCFLFEYIIRIIGSEHPLKKIFKLLMIIDLLVLISFILPVNLVHLRFLRILKLLTIFKSRRYKYALHTMIRVCKDEKESLIVVGVFFFVLILISSSLMCIAEGELQTRFSSILRAMWWAVMTSTSVGYGDLVPITAMGKVIASFTAIFGILLYSMLTALFATGFSKELKRVSNADRKKEEKK